MFGFPPLPPIEGMHPLVVHFPLGLLLIVWMPVVIGLFDKKRRSAWMMCAVFMLVMGTLFTFGAVFTGEAAEEIIGSKSELIDEKIHQHEETGERARMVFVIVTLLFSTTLFLANRQNKKRSTQESGQGNSKRSGSILVPIAVLSATLMYLFAMMTLANAGHQGGVLVHEYGVHAPIGDPNRASSVVSPSMNTNGDHISD
jgi:uncharacterized membrane protein